MKKTYITLTPIALVATMMMSQAYADHTVLHDVVVTATPMTSPFLIETDPKQPRQPLPAHDGADYLKTIPGFTVMRKGGTDGEAIFRGMAGSRLNIMVDDQNIVGGCSGRMDAPTAYIFPEIYDKLTIIKGPQTVEYGNMGSAATIKFDREPKKYVASATNFYASGLVGSFGRNDEIIEADTGNEKFYTSVMISNSQSGNYKDGDGREYHSGYHRWSSNAALGVTPDSNTRLELSAAKSDGWAKYADRGMDGTKFLRENLALTGSRKNISDFLDSVSFQLSHNEVDHIMDDKELRPGMNMGWARVGHVSDQGKISAGFNLNALNYLKAGIDMNKTTHGKGTTMSVPNPPMVDNAVFTSKGVFAQNTYQYNPDNRLVSGLRVDAWTAEWLTTYMSRSKTLTSGFFRNERNLSKDTLLHVGFGHAQRFPDYWELISPAGTSSAPTSAQFYSLKPEKTNQIDIGVSRKDQVSTASLTGYYSKVNDFILIDYANNDAVNVDATIYGLELDASYKPIDALKFYSMLAYTKGKNETMKTTLAQVPPLEGRLGVSYSQSAWTYGALLRLVSGKNSWHSNYGNIAGKDLGASGGFGIFSLNAAYKPSKKITISTGVDNLFDKTYAEFVSRTGNPSMGPSINPQTTRVNEPGRTAWLKATIALD